MITPRTADNITSGHWIVRFAGTKRNTGMIARTGVTPTGDHFGGRPVFDAPCHISEQNGTTLASAKKIIEILGYDDVVCLVAWEFDRNTGETTGDRFDWH